VRLGFAITRASSVHSTWTTLHLARAALARGHRVRFIEPWDFEVDPRGQLVARAHTFDEPQISADEMAEALTRRTAGRRFVDVTQLDVLMLRVAPLTTSVITFAQLAAARGLCVVNDPHGVVAVSHKAWLASIADLPTPATLVTRSRGAAHVFAEQRRNGVVVKPARGSGGRAVSLVRRGDALALDHAFDEARQRGDGYVVVQSYLSAAAHGEKRLVWLDGQLLGGYLRRRAPGEFRHNLKRGGIAEAAEITDTDQAIAARLSPHLLRVGVRLAGLDVIGEHVIEVNALNPGGAYHVDRLTGSNLADVIITRIESPPCSPPERTRWAHLVP